MAREEPHHLLRRPLLQTKLSMPRVRSHPVTRPRLIDILNDALAEDGTIRRRLSLVEGPAGYGKSTLVCQWAQQLSLPVAWLSLDGADNDPARFLAYLFAAVATVRPAIGEAALARLSSTYIYNDEDAILTAFVNDLAICQEPIVVVLDDYHLIENESVHEIMRFLLQHMPQQLHLVVTSRAQPPLPLALLRARHALIRVEARDLQFTVAEAAHFMQETMGLVLSEAQIERLNAQVEGWITGYQLIALALQEEVALEEAFSGSHRYLVDYLADQVLDQQPAELQQFMLQTAILPQFNRELCEWVTGQACAGLLRQVEAANLFLIPLDSARNWYRYHHLFADFLTGRLQRRCEPEAIAALHSRAATWYRERGEPLVAVDHALAASDFDLAADLMAVAGRELLMFGEGNTLRHWLEMLPEEVRQARPGLRLFFVWALIRTRELAKAKSELQAVSESLENELQWGEWLALRARLAVLTGDTEVNIRYSQKALARLPADQHMLRSEVAINLGLSHLQQADLAAAEQAFAEAARHRAHDPGLWAVLFATFYWGETLERQARPQDAFPIYEQGLNSAREMLAGRPMSPAVGFMHVGLGNLLLEWNRLDEAEVQLRQALRWAERSGDHKMLYYSREGLARLLAAAGDWPAALNQVEAIEGGGSSAGMSILRAELAWQYGDLAMARRWLAGQSVSLEDDEAQIRELPFIYLNLLRIQLAEQQYAGLLPLQQKLTAFIKERQNQRLQIEMWLLEALIRAGQGELADGTRPLLRALLRAEPAGYQRLFLNYQSPLLHRLLHQVAGNGASTAAYARQLLAQCGEPILAELQPLSPREMEVLLLLAQGLSNRSIAEQMVVSLNTVKAHTRRLYDKLDVNSRGQAVARARALRLLDSA
ncbi:MAG: AAA family ATPase [Anaerolineales bacterium]|nr:AAA family ATPase [Anaerolineales bacterium]